MILYDSYGLWLVYLWVFHEFFHVLPFTSRCWKWPWLPGESEHHQVLLRQHLGLWCGAQGPKQEPSRREGGTTEATQIYAVHQYCVYVLCLQNFIILYIYYIYVCVSIFIYVWLYVFALHRYMCECMHVYICSCASYCRCLHIFAISLHCTNVIFMFYVDVLHTCYTQDNTLAKPTSIWLDACMYVFVKLIANSCCLLSCSS